MVYYIKSNKNPHNTLTLMIITLDNVSDYLNSGATLDDVRSMIEMLQEYQEEILNGIDEWHDLIPEVPADENYNGGESQWGTKARRKDLKTIVTWLRRMGYVLRLPQLAADGDSCTWEVIKGEAIGLLTWADMAYQVAGLPQPDENPNQAFPFPSCLTWI